MWVIESFVVGVLFTCRPSILLPSRPAGLARCANRRREAPDAAEPLHDREVGRRYRARQKTLPRLIFKTSGRAAALLRLTAVTVGRTDTALGAF